MRNVDEALESAMRQLRKEYFRVAYGNNLPDQWSWCVRYTRLDPKFERYCAARIARRMNISEVLRSFAVLRHLFKTTTPVLEQSHKMKCWVDDAPL